MALKDVLIQKEKVEFDGVEFEVRGLSLVDLVGLFKDYKEQVSKLFNMFAEVKDDETIGALIGTALDIAPDLMSAAVAVASDEPDQVEVVKKLPVPVMVDALTKVAKLTFKSEEEFVDFINALAEMVGASANIYSQTGESS